MRNHNVFDFITLTVGLAVFTAGLVAPTQARAQTQKLKATTHTTKRLLIAGANVSAYLVPKGLQIEPNNNLLHINTEAPADCRSQRFSEKLKPFTKTKTAVFFKNPRAHTPLECTVYVCDAKNTFCKKEPLIIDRYE